MMGQAPVREKFKERKEPTLKMFIGKTESLIPDKDWMTEMVKDALQNRSEW